MSRIKEWLDSNYIYIIIALLILFAVMVWCNVSASKNNKVLNTNLTAAIEAVDTLRTRNNELLIQHQSYISTINELEKYIGISKDEIKSLQKCLDDKILYISKLQSSISITPGKTDTVVVYKDSIFNFTFKYSDEWYELTGNSSFDYKRAITEINSLYVDVPLKVGLTDDWKIFVSTPNPYVSFSDLDGAVLDKSAYLKETKTRHWGFGVSVGLYGGYNIINKNIYVGPGGGLSFTYLF